MSAEECESSAGRGSQPLDALLARIFSNLIPNPPKRMKTLHLAAAAGLLLALTTGCTEDESEACVTGVDTMVIYQRELAVAQREAAVAERERALGMGRGNSGASYSTGTSAANGDKTPAVASTRSGTGTDAPDRVVYNDRRARTGTDGNNHTTYRRPVGVPGQYPEGSTRTLTQEDIQNATAWGKSVMLAEIYARHGGAFSDAALKRHFDGESWYKASPRKRNIDRELTATERANVAFLRAAGATAR